MSCPDCGNQWDIEETPSCEGCGLGWADIEAAAEMFDRLTLGGKR